MEGGKAAICICMLSCMMDGREQRVFMNDGICTIGMSERAMEG